MFRYFLIFISLFVFACNDTTPSEVVTPTNTPPPVTEPYQQTYTSKQIATHQVYIMQLSNKCKKGDQLSCMQRDEALNELSNMMENRK